MAVYRHLMGHTAPHTCEKREDSIDIEHPRCGSTGRSLRCDSMTISAEDPVSDRSMMVAGLIRHPSALLLYGFLTFVTLLAEFDASIGPRGRSVARLGVAAVWFVAGAFWCFTLGANFEMRSRRVVNWAWWFGWALIAIFVAVLVVEHQAISSSYYVD